MSLKNIKSTLRSIMIERRDALDPADKLRMDRELTERTIEIIRKNGIKTVHSYISMGSEINLLPLLNFLLNEKITVITPRSLINRRLENLVLHTLSELETGIYGTSHPANSSVYEGNYDMIIVPGLAFDKEGFRLGYGAGYYDTFLATQPEALKVGLCYPFQLVEKVPTEPHDIKLDKLIFPAG